MRPSTHAPLGPRHHAIPRWLGMVAGLGLVLGIVAEALHHHSPEEVSHPCVTCSLSHTPATPAVTLDVAPPSRPTELAFVAPRLAPPTIAFARPSSRAPPLA